MTVSGAREELVATLEEALRLQRRLVDDARDDSVPVADLVTQVTVLERLDDQRDKLIDQLRRTTSASIRATRTSPPIREVVLEILEELRWPQNSGFLEEYLWAKQQLHLGSRAFAPLRRDERLAWQRAPDARDAYIVTAINPDGSTNPRWLARSDWPLPRRVVASKQTERLFDLQKIYSLAGRPGDTDAYSRGPRGAMDALLEKYAMEILQTEPLPVSASADQIRAWRDRVREHARGCIGELRRQDEPEREEIARHLEKLPDHARLWGQDPEPRPAKNRSKRAR